MISAGSENQEQLSADNTIHPMDDKGKDKCQALSSESDSVYETSEDESVTEEDQGNCVASDSDSDQFEVIEEDPFEPVYTTPSAAAAGVTIEAVSLDNILPSGSRRRH